MSKLKMNVGLHFHLKFFQGKKNPVISRCLYDFNVTTRNDNHNVCLTEIQDIGKMQRNCL